MIAEADPVATDHAIIVRSQADAVPWAVLATDGAYKTMTYLGIADWPALRNASNNDLAELLERCRSWKQTKTPAGRSTRAPNAMTTRASPSSPSPPEPPSDTDRPQELDNTGRAGADVADLLVGQFLGRAEQAVACVELIGELSTRSEEFRTPVGRP